MRTNRVRFEEVTPTNKIVAYFNAQLSFLLLGTGLPIFSGFDDLDYIQFAYLTLPSGNIVVLGQYENAPGIGVDLYVELDESNLITKATNIPALVVETLRYLAILRATAVWLHPDYEAEIDRLYASSKLEGINRGIDTVYEPIDCFDYAMSIYTKEKFPEYWAILRSNKIRAR